ncbi:MAG TPA: N-acyl homoserine lactonase family protein [Bryobacteraceae bacterium]
MNKPVAILFAACLAGTAAAQPPKASKSLRLYIFNCGTIHTTNGDAYSLKKEEMGSTEMAIPCFLVVDPKGVLMWDNGDIPDSVFKPGGGPASVGVVTQDKPLLLQLAAVGYTPADIRFLAMSHYHGDHVANANAFAGSTWLVRKVERDRMFSDTPIPRSDSANYSKLKDSKTIIIDKDRYDVFGDGKVIIISTPGHTPGHQSLFLKFAKTGPVVLSGDLYHYPEERTLHRLPVAEFNKDQTAASRAQLDLFLKKTGAQLWIQHDFLGNAKLKKAPDFYE